MSRQTNQPSLDFKMLMTEIRKRRPTVQITVLCRRIEKRPIEVIRKEFFYIYKQMYHLATAKLCVIDGYNIPISVLKHRKGFKVIQIWHALGAIKKFGRQTMNSRSKRGLAKGFKMHENYDILLAPSSRMAKIYGQAFGYDEVSFGKYLLPHVDYLLDEKEALLERFHEEYPEMKKKKLILYAPTFREHSRFDFTSLIGLEPKGYVIASRIHKNTKLLSWGGSNEKSPKGTKFPIFSNLQLLAIADVVVTDYSSMAFEAMTVDVPLYFYVPDIGFYENNPGLNIDPRELLPKATFSNPKDLMKAIRRDDYDWKTYRKVKARFLSLKTTRTNTKNIAKIILKEMEE